MSSEESLTVEILRQIHGEVAMTRAEVAKTNERLEHLETSTNRRLDFLAEGQTRLHTEVVELRASVDRNGDRFEHFLHTNGDAIRDLRDRMGRVEKHIGLT